LIDLSEQVKSVSELEHFNHIWMEAWAEKGYDIDDSQSLEQYLIKDDAGFFVGTVEFKRYSPTESEINGVFLFSCEPTIQAHKNHIVEIDKVAIMKNHRGRNLDRLLAFISLYTEKHGYRYGICLLEPLFYKALKYVYQLPIKQAGKKRYYKGDDVIPSIINLGYVNQNRFNYSWLTEVLSK
jgi:hypothetical protein